MFHSIYSIVLVLWKRYGNEIHYTVGGSLMQVIGTISGITVWALVDGFKGFPNVSLLNYIS